MHLDDIDINSKDKEICTNVDQDEQLGHADDNTKLQRSPIADEYNEKLRVLNKEAYKMDDTEKERTFICA